MSGGFAALLPAAAALAAAGVPAAADPGAAAGVAPAADEPNAASRGVMKEKKLLPEVALVPVGGPLVFEEPPEDPDVITGAGQLVLSALLAVAACSLSGVTVVCNSPSDRLAPPLPAVSKSAQAAWSALEGAWGAAEALSPTTAANPSPVVAPCDASSWLATSAAGATAGSKADVASAEECFVVAVTETPSSLSTGFSMLGAASAPEAVATALVAMAAAAAGAGVVGPAVLVELLGRDCASSACCALLAVPLPPPLRPKPKNTRGRSQPPLAAVVPPTVGVAVPATAVAAAAVEDAGPPASPEVAVAAAVAAAALTRGFTGATVLRPAASPALLVVAVLPASADAVDTADADAAAAAWPMDEAVPLSFR